MKGKSWEFEKKVRLLVYQQTTRIAGEKDERPIRALDIPIEAIEEVYVGFNTHRDSTNKMY